MRTVERKASLIQTLADRIPSRIARPRIAPAAAVFAEGA
jgi:hypothetical protein